MALTERQKWIQKFINREMKLTAKIVEHLPTCMNAPGVNPLEDDITLNLVDSLFADGEFRKHCQYVDFQNVSRGVNDIGDKYAKGLIDFSIILDQNWVEYIAYEAKRLNICKNNHIISNVGSYVLEGVMRYSNCQYAQDMPIGCMLGYVLGGSMTTLEKKLKGKIDKERKNIKLISKFNKITGMGSSLRFKSTHDRGKTNGNIVIIHTIIPI